MPRSNAPGLHDHSYAAAVALAQAQARWWPQRVQSLTLLGPIAFALLRHDDDGGS